MTGHEANMLFDVTDYPTQHEQLRAEWVGMPAYEQRDLLAIKQLTVSFYDESDVAAFGELIGQKVTLKTRGVNFPSVDYEPPSAFAYVDGEDDECR
jgi:hypothetical protein